MTSDHELRNRFTFHKANADQASRYERIRSTAHAFAVLMNEHCPDSREKSLAMTKLDEVVMWANAAIARNEAGA